MSAVRTLALCAATGALLMRKPLRVGRAHGVRIVFLSLQPAVPIYLGALVVEQLVHTCTSETTYSLSWRRYLFHGMMSLVLVSGLMRARAPLRETDMPFLITAGALLVVAILPPPAVAFVGPLCQSVTVWEAADRLVRSLAFGSLYCAHVYASTSSSTLTTSETMIVVTRSASASLWTMGSHVSWLPVAALQCGVVAMARIHLEQNSSGGTGSYRGLPTDTPTEDEDLERVDEPSEEQGLLNRATRYSPSLKERSIDVVALQRELLTQPTAVQMAYPALNGPLDAKLQGAEHEPDSSCAFGPMAFREVSDNGEKLHTHTLEPSNASVHTPHTGGTPMTAARMAEIAANIPDDQI